MLVDQIEWEIEQTDPRKTIQVGSFRIKPDGTQELNEVSTGVSHAFILVTLKHINANCK